MTMNLTRYNMSTTYTQLSVWDTFIMRSH